MNISISTYTVQKGDTLETVAEKFHISVEALRRYHNTYCQLEDLIGKDLGNIKEIMIPSSDEIEKIKKELKKQADINQLPSYYLNKNFYAPQYTVSESIEREGKETIDLSYVLSIKLSENRGKGYLAKAETIDYRKEGQQPDDKASMLSVACMESISPIYFEVPAQGEIRGIYDYKNFVKQSEHKDKELTDFFADETSERYIKKFFERLKDEKNVIRLFRSNLLYQCMFLKMDWFHQNEEWQDWFYVLPIRPAVKCNFRAEYDFDRPHNVKTTIHGTLQEDISLQNLITGKSPESPPTDTLTIDIELNYMTSKETKRLEELWVSVVLLEGESLYRQHTLTIISKKDAEGKKKITTLVED